MECSHCGAWVPRRARVCKQCGSDAETGWSDDAGDLQVDTSFEMDEDDYEDYLAREFPEHASPRTHGKRMWPMIVLALVLFAMVAWLVL